MQRGWAAKRLDRPKHIHRLTPALCQFHRRERRGLWADGKLDDLPEFPDNETGVDLHLEESAFRSRNEIGFAHYYVRRHSKPLVIAGKTAQECTFIP
jgi:hypothetical protein